MKKHLERKEILMSIFFFNCVCKLCKNGKVNDKYDQGMTISCLSTRTHTVFQQINLFGLYAFNLRNFTLLPSHTQLLLTFNYFQNQIWLIAGLIFSLQMKTSKGSSITSSKLMCTKNSEMFSPHCVTQSTYLLYLQ